MSTITWQKNHNRWRVYVPMGKGHNKAKQAVFSPSKYGGKKKAYQAAKAQHDAWVEQYPVVNRFEHPFILPKGYRSGATKKSPIEIRHIQLVMDSNCKSYPDWDIKKTYQRFHTYPPALIIQQQHNKGRYRQYVRYTIRDSRDYDDIWTDLIDRYLEIMPHYEQHRPAMYAKKPSWKELWAFIKFKYNQYYDDEI